VFRVGSAAVIIRRTLTVLNFFSEFCALKFEVPLLLYPAGKESQEPGYKKLFAVF